MKLTELPFTTPGKIFRSAMPFSSFDPDSELLSEYKNRDISMVIMLSSDEENLQITGRDLRHLYEKEGLQVLSFPILDFGTPDIADMREAVHKALDYSQSGSGMVIHCHAGLGRTGMFAACLAKEEMEFSSDEAINWVRGLIPGAVEVPEQELLIRNF